MHSTAVSHSADRGIVSARAPETDRIVALDVTTGLRDRRGASFAQDRWESAP